MFEIVSLVEEETEKGRFIPKKIEEESVKSCECCPFVSSEEILDDESDEVELKLSGSEVLCICEHSDKNLAKGKWSQSTIEFVLDPKAKRKLKKSEMAKTEEEEEQEKADKYRLFQLDCEEKEAVKIIKRLSNDNLLLISKKRRRDADLQRYETKLGDKTIKLNCVQHNWELFEVQENHRALRSAFIVELAKEREIDKETKYLLERVGHLSGLANKANKDSLDNLAHLRVRWEIQSQLYEQEFERFQEEKMVLDRDLRLLEESHMRTLTAARDTLKELKKEHRRLKRHYLKLLEKTKKT